MAALFAIALLVALIASINFAHRRQWRHFGFGVAAFALAITGIALAAPSDQITIKQLQVSSAVAYTVTNKDDATQAKGTNKVIQNGINGERDTTYSVTYKNGVEQSRKQISSVVAVQPVNEIMDIGTLVAVVPATPAPQSTPAPTTPSSNGHTAMCNDGTYSDAVNHQGACSHHGGVAVWYQ